VIEKPHIFRDDIPEETSIEVDPHRMRVHIVETPMRRFDIHRNMDRRRKSDSVKVMLPNASLSNHKTPNVQPTN